MNQRKGMAATALILGIVSGPTGGCVVGALLALVLGAAAYKQAKEQPAVYGGRDMAIAGMVLGAVGLCLSLLIMCAIAIPSVMRAHLVRNESAAVGDVRTFISAEAAYQSANEGYFGTFECLASPANCLPDHPGGVRYLEGQLADKNGPSQGYVHSFHGGEPAKTSATVPRGSLNSYAFVAEPATRGETGVRAFCGDSTGRVCAWADGQPTKITGGLCPADCRTIY